MAYNKEEILSKFRAMVSALYALVLWGARLSYPMQSPKALPHHQYLQLPIALTTLISSTSKNLNRAAFSIIRSYLKLPSLSSATTAVAIAVSTPPTPLLSPATSSSSSSLSLSLSFLDESNSSSPSSSWSNSLGDLLGTESGICISPGEDIPPALNTKPFTNKKRSTLRERRHRETLVKEYPPPIPLLAQTGNKKGRMPWVLTREYVDGRLILREVREERYEYFETTRDNGRLVLKLVHLPPVQCRHLAPKVINKDVKEDEDINATEEENEVKEEIEVKKMGVGHPMVQKEAMVSSPNPNPNPSPSPSPSLFGIDAMVQSASPSMASSI